MRAEGAAAKNGKSVVIRSSPFGAAVFAWAREHHVAVEVEDVDFRSWLEWNHFITMTDAGLQIIVKTGLTAESDRNAFVKAMDHSALERYQRIKDRNSHMVTQMRNAIVPT